MLNLVRYPSDILTKKSEEIINIDSFVKDLAADMLSAAKSLDGIGLAAPQIGQNIRLIVVNLSDEPTPIEKAFVNPKIMATSKLRNSQPEGCLSIPNVYGNVFRWNSITIEFDDLDGIHQQLVANGLYARVLQHEIDHLNGTLFLSHNRQALIEANRLYKSAN